LVFEKNANFFRRKLSKIAENCDHNIDPVVDEKRILKKGEEEFGVANPKDLLRGFKNVSFLLAHVCTHVPMLKTTYPITAF
jgi:hypothetical protein